MKILTNTRKKNLKHIEPSTIANIKYNPHPSQITIKSHTKVYYTDITFTYNKKL